MMKLFWAAVLPLLMAMAADARPLAVLLPELCPTNGMVAMEARYARALRRAGHVPLVMPATTNRQEIAATVELADVVLFCGGPDVEPRRYGEGRSSKCGKPNLKRDAFEWAVMDVASAQQKPVAGICRGEQFINAYFGGTLHQDVPSELANPVRHSSLAVHEIAIRPDSRLAKVLGTTKAAVNSWHHQGVKGIAPGFRAVAWSADGLVEAIEAVDRPIAGVQFHPEAMSDEGSELADKLLANLLEWVGAASVPRPRIIPAPLELTWDDGELRAAGLLLANAECVPAYALESLKPLAAEKGKPLLFSRDTSLGEQSYRLKVTPSELVATASSDAGFIHAAMTLLQLAARDGRGWRIPCCRIADSPAFGLRAINWLLFVESRGWSQDAGDGVEGIYRRSVATLDRMARYKVNGAFADGFGWNPERFPGYGELMRRIASAARKRGIKIGFGGYYAGYGAQYFDWDGPKFHNLDAEGKPFACIGRSRGLPYAAMGTCVTDERLVAAKAANLRAFAQSVHPGFLYIHGMDLARPADLAKYWKDRCPACRAKWPNDALDAADGAAGAYANLYDRLFEGATGWADAGTGYDPAKDCTFCFVSPNYGIFDLDDSEWSRICGYYRVLARCLRNKSIRFTVREQFMREDGADTRYAELRRAVGADAKFLGCIFTGCDGYYSSNLYSNDVENVRLYAGATDLFYATGNAFQVPRQVAAGAAMWNPAAVPSLEAVCESLVGAKDGPVLAAANRGYPVLPLTSKRLPGYYFSDAWYDSEGALGLGWLSNNVSRVDAWQKYRSLLVDSLADTARAEAAFGRVAHKDEQFRRNAETCRESRRIGRLALDWTDAALLAIKALEEPSRKSEALAKCAALLSAAKELESDYAARLERMTDPNGGDVRAGLDHAQFLIYEAESMLQTLEKGVWREHPHRPWW